MRRRGNGAGTAPPWSTSGGANGANENQFKKITETVNPTKKRASAERFHHCVNAHAIGMKRKD
jgi:hypothetical protein